MNIDYITLFYQLANDVGLDPYTVKYCVRRIKSEGITFLTVTLPSLSKAVISSLEKGFFDRPLGFQWKRKSLAVFGKFLNKIFDQNTGAVLPEVDALALYCLRQICDYFYKLALPFTKEQISNSTSKFVDTDDDIRDDQIDFAFVDILRKKFETYMPQFTRDTIDEVLKEHKPRSGPGTFSSCVPMDIPWYLFKHVDYRVPTSLAALSWASKPTAGSPMPSLLKYDTFSELLFVPKDSRGPRTIVREPYHYLRYQMAFNSYLSYNLERYSRKRINFADQSVNRSLAERASLDKRNATIDLKDASDRVSFSVVKKVFSNCPALRWFLNHCRTKKVKLPNGTLKPLNKLSGMGSGFTFPTMSLLIYLASCEAISRFGTLTFREAMKVVYVYGDDLIIPRVYLRQVELALYRVGLRVNLDKTFHRSYFRESCGGDYYRGQDVTPVRLKLGSCDVNIDYRSRNICVAGELSDLQVERHCRELVKAGLLRTSQYYYRLLTDKYGPLPLISGESPVFGEYRLYPTEYPMDEFGNYTPIRCIVPVSKTKHVGEAMDPYMFLADCLRMAGKDSSGRTYGEVTLPRSVKYRRVSVPGFRLMG